MYKMPLFTGKSKVHPDPTDTALIKKEQELKDADDIENKMLP